MTRSVVSEDPRPLVNDQPAIKRMRMRCRDRDADHAVNEEKLAGEYAIYGQVDGELEPAEYHYRRPDSAVTLCRPGAAMV
jgi:hypothetical protein